MTSLKYVLKNVLISSRLFGKSLVCVLQEVSVDESINRGTP